MRYYYNILFCGGIVTALALLYGLWSWLGRARAYRRVKSLTQREKLLELDEALAPVGFSYDPQGDLLTTGMYPWHREMGYCRQYDKAAPSMFMIYERETVYFTYKGKRFLAELQKGQYGCATGAKIGLFVNTDTCHGERPEGLFYRCAGDEERLKMKLVLYKKEDKLLERQGLHWCLSGFLPGMYSEPEELQVKFAIQFPDTDMRDAFRDGLLSAGYEPSRIEVKKRGLTFLFDHPCRREQEQDRRLTRRLVCLMNRSRCSLYHSRTKSFETNLDKICYLGYCSPVWYRRILRIGTKYSNQRLRRYRRRKEDW